METTIHVDDDLTMRLLSEADADDLYSVTDANRAYLRRWLPWLDHVRSPDDSSAFIRRAGAQLDRNQGPTFGIFFGGKLCGVAGFHPIDRANDIAEIGYWIAEDAQGRGIVTRCCRALLRMAFEELGINRLQIPAAVDNSRSRAIPERLGMTYEGIIRQRERLYEDYVDHAMYSMLKREYLATAPHESIR